MVATTRDAARKAKGSNLAKSEGIKKSTEVKSKKKHPASIATIQPASKHVKPFRGSWLDTVLSDNDADDEIDIELDELDYTGGGIDMLELELQEIRHGLHLALGDRIPANHLADFPWLSPSSAPSSARWPRTPDSAKSERTRELEQSLRDRDLQTLLDADREFWRLMGDLQGISEWWTKNRAEWRKRKSELLDVENTIDVLKTLIIIDKPNDFQGQLKLQEERRAKCLEYFTENEKLMKTVVARFHKIEEEKEVIQGAFEPDQSETNIHAFSFPADFDYACPKTGILELGTETLCWQRPGKTYLWWLNIALEHLEHIIISHRARIAKAVQQHHMSDEVAQRNRDEIKKIKSAHEAALKVIDTTLEDLNLRRANSRLTPAQLDNITAELRSQQKERKTLDDNMSYKGEPFRKGIVFEVRKKRETSLELEMYERSKHMASVILAAGRTARAALLSKNSISSVGHIVEFMKELYCIICMCQQEVTHIEMIRKWLANRTIDQKKRDRILNICVATFTNDDLKSKEDEWLVLLEHAALDVPHSLGLAGIECYRIIEARDAIVENAFEILKGDTLQRTEPRRNHQSPDRHNPRRSNERSHHGQGSGHGNNNDGGGNSSKAGRQRNQSRKLMTITEAEAIIHSEEIQCLNGGIYTIDVALRNFFTSPDVAPWFWNMAPLSREEFYKIVNRMCYDKLQDRQIEAFVISCSNSKNIFELSRDGANVLPCDFGWEIVSQNEVVGPKRKLLWICPEGTDDVRRLLRSSWEGGRLSAPPSRMKVTGLIAREVLFEKLIQETERIPGTRFDRVLMKDILDYLRVKGEFFINSRTKTDSYGEPFLQCVNNGWNPNRLEKFILPTGPIVGESYFPDIHHLVSRPDVMEHLAAAFERKELEWEADLYDALEPFWRGPRAALPGKVGYIRTPMTRLKFHLFLRSADSNDRYVFLGIDGRIKPRRTWNGTTQSDEQQPGSM